MDIFDLALNFTPRVGGRTAQKLIEDFGSAKRLFECSKQEILQRSAINQSVAEAIAERVGMPQAEAEMAYCERNNIQIISFVDDVYPSLLREIHDAPYILFAIGDLGVLQANMISMIGTREMSSYGEKSTMAIVEQLKDRVRDVAIVSGLAYGIDGAAHRSALHFEVPTVAVLPSPLHTITPAQHLGLARDILSSGGLILSEYASTAKMQKSNYLARNRIVAGLSAATILVESPEKGGAMATARMAHEEQRLVFAVPGRMSDPSSAGCNRLIARRCALPYINVDTLIYELGWDNVRIDPRGKYSVDGAALPKGVTRDLLSLDHLALLRCFEEEEALHISQIEALSQIEPNRLGGLLIELELFELIKTLPGANYEICIALEALD